MASTTTIKITLATVLLNRLPMVPNALRNQESEKAWVATSSTVPISSPISIMLSLIHN